MELDRINYFRAVHPELSASEARVYMHVQDELTNRQIAKIYGCSVRNIENHRYRIGKKLGKIAVRKQSSGERVAPHYESPTVGENGAANGANKNGRARLNKTSGSRSESPVAPTARRRAVARVEHAGTGGHRSTSGRWLLPGVLFQLEALEAWA